MNNENVGRFLYTLQSLSNRKMDESNIKQKSLKIMRIIGNPREDTFGLYMNCYIYIMSELIGFYLIKYLSRGNSFNSIYVDSAKNTDVFF